MSLVADGSISFRGGQNDAVIAGQIPKDQYRRGINLTTDKGVLRPRPGFHHEKFRVTKETRERAKYQTILDTGKFQAAASFDADNGFFVVAAICGLLFRLDIDALQAELIPFEDEGDRMSQYRRRIPWSYAGKFLVFFDYPNRPVIIENFMARRANRDEYEIPTSILGAFNQNRLWVGNAGHEFGASDPVGGNANAPITFNESLAPAQDYTGQFFSLGTTSHNKPLSHMGFLQVADTATGIGPLLVSTKDAIYAYRSDIPRSEWENTVFGRLMLYNAGVAGPRAGANLNSDFLFLSGDNRPRSLFFGSSEQQRWSNTPIGEEVEVWLKAYENKELLDIAVCTAGDNRFFFAVAPYATTAISLDGREVFDYAHGGMVVLELANVTQLGQQPTPAWTGLWTGINPMEMVNTAKGMYVFSKDSDGYNRVYRVDPNSAVDVFEGEERDITCRVYTREYDGDNRFSDKQIRQACYALTNVEGDLSFRVEYKPSHDHDWHLWHQFCHRAKTTTRKASKTLTQLARHHFRDLNFGDPVEIACDKLTEDNVALCRQLALRITVKARFWQVEAIRLLFEDFEETNKAELLNLKTAPHYSAVPTIASCGQLPHSITLNKEISDWAIHETIKDSPVWQ